MKNLTKQESQELLDAIQSINKFIKNVNDKITKRKLDDDDVKEIKSKLDHIQSEAAYIVDILTTKV